MKELEAKARPLPQSPCAHPWPCSDTQQVAALVGKEAGLYVPSGTMSNLIAVCVWCGAFRVPALAAARHAAH